MARRRNPRYLSKESMRNGAYGALRRSRARFVRQAETDGVHIMVRTARDLDRVSDALDAFGIEYETKEHLGRYHILVSYRLNLKRGARSNPTGFPIRWSEIGTGEGWLVKQVKPHLVAMVERIGYTTWRSAVMFVNNRWRVRVGINIEEDEYWATDEDVVYNIVNIGVANSEAQAKRKATKAATELFVRHVPKSRDAVGRKPNYLDPTLRDPPSGFAWKSLKGNIHGMRLVHEKTGITVGKMVDVLRGGDKWIVTAPGHRTREFDAAGLAQAALSRWASGGRRHNPTLSSGTEAPPGYWWADDETLHPKLVNVEYGGAVGGVAPIYSGEDGTGVTDARGNVYEAWAHGHSRRRFKYMDQAKAAVVRWISGGRRHNPRGRRRW